MPWRLRRSVVVLYLFVALSMLGVVVVRRAAAGPSDGLPKIDSALDRSTPRRAVEGYLQASHTGDWTRAAHYLDLRAVKAGEQPTVGPKLAEELVYVLDRELPLRPDRIPDDPEGAGLTEPPAPAPAGKAPSANALVTAVPTAAGGAALTLGTIPIEEEPTPISLARVKFDDGVFRWIFARPTVSAVPVLYRTYGPHGWEDKLPDWSQEAVFGNAIWQWVALVLSVLGSYLVGRASSFLLTAIALRIAKRTKTTSDDALVIAARRPLRAVLAVLLFEALLDDLNLTLAAHAVAHQAAVTLLVVALAWFTLRALSAGAEWAAGMLPSEGEVDVKRRVLRTQLEVLRRIASVVIVLVAGAVVLIQFEFVRNVGISLLASAGLATVVVGFAAQKSVAGIIAGVQLSITQPVRIGDRIVVEGENGIVEEINLTYVVVKLVDRRRLVVPIGRFLEQPFQNWTLTTTELDGTVSITADFRVPVADVRAEARLICARQKEWDGRTCDLEVTDASEKGIIIRVTCSARNASDLWDLRCALREALVTYLQTKDGGRYLPRSRVGDDPLPDLSSGGTA